MNSPEFEKKQEDLLSKDDLRENDIQSKLNESHLHGKRSFLHRIIGKLSGNNIKATGLFWLDVLLNIIIIVALVFIIRTYFISPFQVYGPSMCNTFNFFDNKCKNDYGEYLIVNKFSYQNFFGWQVGLPQRGDIIVFHPPGNESEFYIKRIIGLPGETLKLKNGNVFIYNKDHPEGFELNEPYLSKENKGNTVQMRGDKTIFEIPEKGYFAMGDNRQHSTDSRICFQDTACANGQSFYLTMDHIEGKAWLVLWPLNKLAIQQNPSYN
jgi:signal peptidase I